MNNSKTRKDKKSRPSNTSIDISSQLVSQQRFQTLLSYSNGFLCDGESELDQTSKHVPSEPENPGK